MEPLNLMVSLSHFANDKREHTHGLSRPAGGGCRDGRGSGWRVHWLSVLGNVRRIFRSRVRVLS